MAGIYEHYARNRVQTLSTGLGVAQRLRAMQQEEEDRQRQKDSVRMQALTQHVGSLPTWIGRKPAEIRPFFDELNSLRTKYQLPAVPMVDPRTSAFAQAYSEYPSLVARELAPPEGFYSALVAAVGGDAGFVDEQALGSQIADAAKAQGGEKKSESKAAAPEAPEQTGGEFLTGTDYFATVAQKFVPKKMPPEQARLYYDSAIKRLTEGRANGAIDETAAKSQATALAGFVADKGFPVTADQIVAETSPTAQGSAFASLLQALPEEWRVKKDGTPKAKPEDFSSPEMQERAWIAQRTDFYLGIGIEAKEAVNNAQEDLKERHAERERTAGQEWKEAEHAWDVYTWGKGHEISLANLGIARERLRLAKTDEDKTAAAREVLQNVFGVDEGMAEGLMQMTGEERLTVLRQVGALPEDSEISVEALTKMIVGKMSTNDLRMGNEKQRQKATENLQAAADLAQGLYGILTSKAAGNDLRERSGY